VTEFQVVVEQEDGGEWVAECIGGNGVVQRGATERIAVDRAVALAAEVLRVLTAN
jgi:predicted RNase H-like HicB family nuclease